MAHQADVLKQKGNTFFKSGDYTSAETTYTAAITRNPTNPLLFTNRALTRIRLQKWQAVIEDCLNSIELTGRSNPNFKSYFYLAQAQLALHHPNEALASALTAYEQAMNPPATELGKGNASLGTISEFVIKCKKEKFAARERERRRRRGDMLAELEEALETTKRDSLSTLETSLSNAKIGIVEATEARTEILNSHDKKLSELRSIFAVADPSNQAPREVPDYLVDTISFEIMHDPVITKTGHSYERATLLEHLKRSPYDPLTREPLTIRELRPNVALRQVLDEFWMTAGEWAIVSADFLCPSCLIAWASGLVSFADF